MPPDNTTYLYAGYLAAAVIYGVYALSLWLRARGIDGRDTRRSE
jgi:hypothetical protein